MRHWIFDLDGTLVSSAPSYKKIIIEILEHYGIHLESARHHEITKLLPKKYLEQLLPIEKVGEAFERVVATSLARLSEILVFEGIHPLLGHLRQQGCVLSILTARERRTALAILDHTGLAPHFSHVITRDCVPNCKPHPEGIQHLLRQSGVDSSNAVMIGDHDMDMQCAQAAGIKSIRVSWDGSAGDPSHPSDLHFTKVEELHAWAVSQWGPSSN